jgi:hypothetical protein
MNSKLLLGISIVIAVIGVISVSILIYPESMNDGALIEPSNKHDKDTKTMEELVAMTCEQIIKENIQGLQYFTKEDGNYIEQKVLECLKNEISIEESYLPSKREIKEVEIEFIEEQKLAILQELEQLETMSCDEIIQRNTEGVYLSSDNREFAREKIGDCHDKQELPYRGLHYSSILISAQTPQKFYTEDAYHNLLSGIYSNVVKENNFQLSDVLLQYQIDFCKLYTEEFDAEINACEDIQITTQPYKPTKTPEELYEIIYQNELDIINNIECSELHDTYDGKMHTVYWPPHKDMISNSLNNCKDAG